MQRDRLRGIWYGMKERCLNPNNASYFRYGGRGITICDEWRDDYNSFKAWATKSGYADSLTIDRIDNNLGYCPDNCRWATMKTQSNNRANNVFLEYGGERHTIAEWGDILGIDQDILQQRLKRGLSVEEAFTKPIRTGIYTYDGQSHTLPEWSKIKGISVYTLFYILSHGWSLGAALNTPSRIKNRDHDRIVEYKGESHLISEWAKIIGVQYWTLEQRLNVLGWDVDRALITPVKK